MERYKHVKSVLTQNKSKLKLLVNYVLEKETVTGDNAMRVIHGEKPIEKDVDEDALNREKELSDAYFILSLVDNYSLHDGHVVERVKSEEITHFIHLSLKEMENEAMELVEKGENEDIEKMLKEMEKMRGFSTNDTKRLHEIYGLLLYEHSLDTINVQEVLDKVKKENNL